MFIAKAISNEHVKIFVSRAEMSFGGFREAKMPNDY
jgi:hypothetical protein